MSNFSDHLSLRATHYNSFVSKEHFNQNLFGLHHIELNVSENCTRKCSFCPRFDSSTYPNIKQYMNIELFETFCKRCVQDSYKEQIHFTGFGEPLLNSNVLNFIKMLREFNLTNYSNLTTNGDLLNGNIVEDLYVAGLNHITVSCYEESKHVAYDNMFKGYSSDQFLIRQLWHQTNEGFEDRSNSKKINLNSSCYFPFYKMFIDFNGQVVLCSNDWFRKQELFLNIKTHSLKDIWFSEHLQNIRKNLSNNKRIDPACSSCLVNGKLIGKQSFDLFKENIDVSGAPAGN